MLSDEAFEQLYAPARTARLERRWRLAIQLCTEILQTQPLTPRQQSVLLEMRGICYTGVRAIRRAEQDLTNAFTTAERHRLVHDQAHVLTSLVRLRLIEGRRHTAAERLLPRAEKILAGHADHESMVLRASILGLYGVILFRDGRIVKAFDKLRSVEAILADHPDKVRSLRNSRRLAYLLCWYGRRRDARAYADVVIQQALTITENGDPQSRRLGRYIRFCTWMPVPAKWLLRPFRNAAGL